MIKAVVYDIVRNRVLSFDNDVSETVYPERTHPDFEYFVPYEPYELKNYDSRLEDYKRVETPMSAVHPLYPIYRQWRIEHRYIKRSQSDVFLSIENARRVANATLIDADLYAMSIGIVIKVNNVILTDEENAILLNCVDIHNRLMQNYTNEENLKTSWLENESINIDAGWEKN